jgi:hypothetical protein
MNCISCMHFTMSDNHFTSKDGDCTKYNCPIYDSDINFCDEYEQA